MSGKEKIGGYIHIKTLRGEFEPNWRVYILLKGQALRVGEFDADDWDYAYDLERIDIDRVDIPKGKLPRLTIACMKVAPEWDKVYTLDVLTTLSKDDLEDEIERWLRKEGFKALVEAVKLPKVIKETVTPIPESVLLAAIEKAKGKSPKLTKDPYR